MYLFKIDNYDNSHELVLSKCNDFVKHYLDNPNDDFTYCDVFPDLVSKLQESFRKEQKKVIEIVAKNLVFYESEVKGSDSNSASPLSQNHKEQIETIVKNLQDKHGYSLNGALSVLKYIIKERY